MDPKIDLTENRDFGKRRNNGDKIHIARARNIIEKIKFQNLLNSDKYEMNCCECCGRKIIGQYMLCDRCTEHLEEIYNSITIKDDDTIDRLNRKR